MEFLRSRIRRTKLGEIGYLIINALLPVVLLLLIRNFDSIYPALALVLLSKWRVLALRPRFWWVNIKANAVDLMVGISAVGLMYLSMSSLPLQIGLAVAYAGWTLYLKHRSDSRAIVLQAGIAQFLAITLLFSASTVVGELVVVGGCWIVGYAVARHVVATFEEEYSEMLSCIWGLVFSQLGWLLYHWTVVYDLSLPIKIPQFSLVALVLSFTASRLYVSAKSGRLNEALTRAMIVFSVVLLTIILLFSRWDITI